MALERLTPKKFMSKAGKDYSNKSYTVRISTREGWYVEGISKTPFNFKLSAKYADLFNGLIPGAELLQKTGDASLTTGIFSQKYFQGGNNLDMTVEFRIYDDGTKDINPVIEGARNLASMTVSHTGKAGQAIAGTVAEGFSDIQDVLKKGFQNGFQGISTETTKKIEKYSNKINNRAVTLKIMNLFTCRMMAIQDVSVTYSGAQTHTGPLYGDFSVGLISLQAITRGGGDNPFGVNNILNSRKYNISIDGRYSHEISTYENAIGPRLPDGGF